MGIGGGIAAYKLAEVASTLAKSGAQVRAILTEQAEQFITPLTIGTLCRHPAYGDRDFWHPSPVSPLEGAPQHPLHITLGTWAEVILLAPLTANTLAKLTYGLADNLLTNTLLASTCPVVLAPAMNTDMWQQAAVQYTYVGVPLALAGIIVQWIALAGRPWLKGIGLVGADSWRE